MWTQNLGPLGNLSLSALAAAVPPVTIAAVLGLAYIGNASGMMATMGRALARTGEWFPLFSPVLGWLGVFMTGSDTSANAVFGRLQRVSAEQIGMSPVLAVLLPLVVVLRRKR